MDMKVDMNVNVNVVVIVNLVVNVVVETMLECVIVLHSNNEQDRLYICSLSWVRFTLESQTFITCPLSNMGAVARRWTIRGCMTSVFSQIPFLIG